MDKIMNIRPVVLLLACLATATAATADEEDYLLIHAQSPAYSREIPVDGIDKITFSGNGMNVLLDDESIVNVPYGQIRVITFGQATSVSQQAADEDITVTYRQADAAVTVESPTPVTALRIYNMQGQMIYQSAPNAPSVTVSLSGYPDGIYIIHADNGTTMKTGKIIKH